MPVGRVSSRRELTAIALALGGVAAAVLALFAFLHLAHSGEAEVHLGSDTFEAGQVGRMADRIASDGPLLYPDVSGGTRDLYVNHLGSTVESGWVAFAARSPGSTRACTIAWQANVGMFVDNCTGATYPPDGSGLEQFPVSVNNGNLDVDINHTAERRAQQELQDQQNQTTSSVIESGIPRSATSIAPPAAGVESPTTGPSVTAPSPSGPPTTASPTTSP